MQTPNKKELPKGVCPSCWGKKYNTVMNRETGIGDFVGDKNYDSGSRIDNIPCSKCNGTGKFPVLEEEKKCKLYFDICYGGGGINEGGIWTCDKCEIGLCSPAWNEKQAEEEHLKRIKLSTQQPMEWETRLIKEIESNPDFIFYDWNGEEIGKDLKQFISLQIKQAEERVRKENRAYDEKVMKVIRGDDSHY